MSRINPEPQGRGFEYMCDQCKKTTADRGGEDPPIGLTFAYGHYLDTDGFDFCNDQELVDWIKENLHKHDMAHSAYDDALMCWFWNMEKDLHESEGHTGYCAGLEVAIVLMVEQLDKEWGFADE